MIYLDNAATTKPSENALNKSNGFLLNNYFNPSARYRGGIDALSKIKYSKEEIIKAVGGDFDVIFTSCGSESNNMAVFSYAKRGNSVTTLGEHSAIYQPFLELKNGGYDSRFAKINPDGSVNVEDLLSKVDSNTVFVSVVHVNNETGAINDVNNIAKLLKQKNPKLIFHSDGVQAFGKIPVKLSSFIDLYSVSAHKIGGLKGVGALFKNKKIKNLKPLIYGGGQEAGLRSGTENVYGISVFSEATSERYSNIIKNYEYVSTLKKLFLEKLDKDIFKLISSNNSSPYVVSISAVGLRGEVLQHMLEEDEIIIGTGSACSSKNPHSRVLKEAGYNKAVLDGVIRISFTPINTVNEVEFAVSKINEKAQKLFKAMKKI